MWCLCRQLDLVPFDILTKWVSLAAYKENTVIVLGLLLMLLRGIMLLLITCRGADTEVNDIDSCTPFLLAAANGHVRVVAKLENRTQIDKLDKTRKSAVFLAAEGAHIPLLRV